MSAEIIKFPTKRQLGIIVERDREGAFWVTRCGGQHCWLFGNRWEAFAEARALAHQDSVAVVVRP